MSPAEPLPFEGSSGHQPADVLVRCRIVKVIPERIYSMVVHPDPTRDLVSSS